MSILYFVRQILFIHYYYYYRIMTIITTSNSSGTISTMSITIMKVKYTTKPWRSALIIMILLLKIEVRRGNVADAKSRPQETGTLHFLLAGRVS